MANGWKIIPPEINTPPAIVFSDADKRKFAINSLKNPKDNFKAALSICGHNTAVALQLAAQWPYDPEIISLKEQLIEEYGQEAFLPTKADVVNEVIDMARDTSRAPKDRLTAYALAAKMCGYLSEGGATTTVNVQQNNVQQVDYGRFISNMTPDERRMFKALAESAKMRTIEHE